MANILINGISAKSGGGRSILNNYLDLLSKIPFQNNYFIIVPNFEEYIKFKNSNITIIHFEVFSKYTFFLPLFYFCSIKNVIKKYSIDLILNFGDIIIPAKTTQVYLFDWAYAVYPESLLWKRMEFKEKIIRKIKILFIKIYIKWPAVVLAQTKTSELRLSKLFSLKRIEIVPNAVSLDHLFGGICKEFNLPKLKLKLLYLTKYYTHKNIEIFIPLAQLIKEKNLPYLLVITIDEYQHKNAKRLLGEIIRLKLDHVIINLGQVNMEYLPSLYAQSDALLMPTLLESFSGTYVEAMFHGKTILTSDCDFAHEVCGDAAYFFDPLNVESIFHTIQLAFSNEDIRQQKIIAGKQKLNSLLSWEQVFRKIQDIISGLL
jgi:glycosyltransferase involved in cell wall biosynthesis